MLSDVLSAGGGGVGSSSTPVGDTLHAANTGDTTAKARTSRRRRVDIETLSSEGLPIDTAALVRGGILHGKARHSMGNVRVIFSLEIDYRPVFACQEPEIDKNMSTRSRRLITYIQSLTEGHARSQHHAQQIALAFRCGSYIFPRTTRPQQPFPAATGPIRRTPTTAPLPLSHATFI